MSSSLLPAFGPSTSRPSLVRFRAMIQDTAIQNEFYLPHGADHLRSATVLWAVSVPAEPPWRAPPPVHQSSQPHKFPVPGAPHIGVRVKIYDNADAGNLHSTDVVTFVGTTSSEPLCIHEDSSPQVPVLHVLYYQIASACPTPTTVGTSVRTDLVRWISNEALGGDDEAAEWLLLQLASKVHSRAVPLLPPSLTISRFPRPSSPELVPALSHVLAELLPQYLLIPLSLDLLNKVPFLPESKDEDLHSGYLQLPSGTTILLTESAIQEGKLLERGIVNVRAIQNVMNSQTVDYLFPFSNKFTFNTDLPMIVASQGRKSALFQTSINLPLCHSSSAAGFYKSKDEIYLPSSESMATYRSYVAACRDACKKVHVTDVTSKHIQDDFVRWRQRDKSVTPDELVHLMKVARLLAASQLQDEVTIDIWERAKTLDGQRKAR